MNAVDTNVLIYANDSRDPRKQEIAATLISRLDDGILLWQVACEYVWVARKLEDFDGRAAAQHLEDLTEVWRVVVPNWQVHSSALDLTLKHGMPWWDALLVASALEAGVQRLYSEDFSHGQQIGPLSILNPFWV